MVMASRTDKTQVFADQIEVKQAELVPWAAKVTEKKAALDLATSERDLLSKKLEDGKSALQQAEASIGKIKEDVAAKVGLLTFHDAREIDVLRRRPSSRP